jgi:DNA (cytosine-5)-methyltransferase 1
VKSVELFVGAGGLAIGTARAGFEHQAAIEWDRNACDTLRRNRDDGVEHVRDWNIIEGDVRNYDFSKHREHADVVIGGPPCQPFSLGGKHLGCNDIRNMFPEAVRAVREIAPKAFMFENVRGLLRKALAKYYDLRA